jgi:hypothetical protein
MHEIAQGGVPAARLDRTADSPPSLDGSVGARAASRDGPPTMGLVGVCYGPTK